MPHQALLGVGFIMFAMILLLIVFAINVLIIFILYNAFKVVPLRHQKIEAGLIWLLLIPCFPLVWNFFVFIRVPRSFQSYFQEKGYTGAGDCGESLGLTYSILTACGMIPYLGYIASIAGLVVLIIFLVKMNDLKRVVMQYEAAAANVPSTPPTL